MKILKIAVSHIFMAWFLVSMLWASVERSIFHIEPPFIIGLGSLLGTIIASALAIAFAIAMWEDK
jgi:hypothetical protein